MLDIRFDCVVITFMATSAAILHKCDLICCTLKKIFLLCYFIFCQPFVLGLQCEEHTTFA